MFTVDNVVSQGFCIQITSEHGQRRNDIHFLESNSGISNTDFSNNIEVYIGIISLCVKPFLYNFESYWHLTFLTHF